MTDETVQAVVDGLERLLKQHAAVERLEDASQLIQRFTDFLLHQVMPFCNREHLIETLKQKDATAEEEMLIRGVIADFPGIALALFEHALPMVRKEFPTANSGRPKSLTSGEEKVVCEYVGKLHTEGLNIKTAKQRAAQKFNVSVSTINRTWAERKKGHIPSAKEILQIFKAKQASTPKVLPTTQEENTNS
jgi:hypothetical protein